MSTSATFASAGMILRDLDGFDKPGSALGCQDGSLLVTEPAAGRILRVRGDQRSFLVEGLAFPAGLADAGDGAVYVAESRRVLRVGLAEGAVTSVADDLGAVRAVAVGPDGSLAMLDVDGDGCSRSIPRAKAVRLSRRVSRSATCASALPALGRRRCRIGRLDLRRGRPR